MVTNMQYFFLKHNVWFSFNSNFFLVVAYAFIDYEDHRDAEVRKNRIKYLLRYISNPLNGSNLLLNWYEIWYVSYFTG